MTCRTIARERGGLAKLNEQSNEKLMFSRDPPRWILRAVRPGSLTLPLSVYEIMLVKRRKIEMLSSCEEGFLNEYMIIIVHDRCLCLASLPRVCLCQCTTKHLGIWCLGRYMLRYLGSH